MTDTKNPVISDDPMYQLLRAGHIKEFNEKRAAGEAVNLSGFDFRGLDLRGLDVKGLDMSNTYFRQTDIRGIDFSQCNLEGASINAAKISGVLFPIELDPDEIKLSLLYGSRMRYKQ